uniref:Potassium transporter n=1 Tax=Oryza nivara TaxID=4536 RepID=A0A0E0I8D2_ORYNI
MASISDSETTNHGSIWDLDQNLDQPMDEEASRLKNMYTEKKFSSILLLRLAFQSLGVVFGDLGTSPLYVFYNIFPHGVDDDEDVIGALSLIIYTLTLIPLMKYVFVVLRANDNGQVLIGTCTAIGDGILTPAISVLSASGGIRVQNQKMSTDVVVVVAVIILIGLFSMQHYGTDKVGWLFAPIVLLWFILIGTIGALNIHKYNSSVLKAYNPVYIYRYFRRGKSESWTSLGGIMLSITGTEALYADLCHFPVLAIQIAFTLVVFPCLLLAYTGQAAYIISNKDHVVDAFYRSIPGTAVVIVMLVTTFLMVPIMLLVWKSHWILVVIFIVLSLMVELPYFTACINKVDQGGWVPLVVATTCFIIMYVWHFCTVKRYEFEMHSKVSMAWILGLGPSLGLVRVPGIGFVYTELASGVPHIFSHFITNLPAIHSVVVFVCVKYLPVYTVPTEERFIVKRIGPKNFHMFRCVARYGYKDIHKRDDDFEKMLLDRLLLFVRLESMMDDYSDSEDFTMMEEKTQGSSNALLLTGKAGSNTMCSTGDLSYSSQDSIVPAKSPIRGNSLTRYSSQTFGDELEFLNRCKDAGVVHILGNTVVHARPDSGIIKKVAVNYVFAFLRKICRENSVIFNVPHESLLNVGQIYYI